MLTSSAFMLLLGRVYTFYNPKWVFLTIIAIFELGSAICGAAPTSTAFIIGRAIAGFGAAGMTNGAIVIMVNVIPLAKRPIYQGIFGSVFGIASVVGPLLGGAFTQKVYPMSESTTANKANLSVVILALVLLYQPSHRRRDPHHCSVPSEAA